MFPESKPPRSTGRYVHPSYLVFGLPEGKLYRFKLDDRGYLCTSTTRPSKSTAPWDPIDPDVLGKLPAYELVDKTIHWIQDDGRTEEGTPASSTASPIPPLRVARLSIPESELPQPELRAAGGPERRIAPPALQSAPSNARRAPLPEPELSRAERMVYASSPFNPTGPFQPRYWLCE
jgi:hypothetical protein